MDVSARRAFALLKELAYVRVSCTEEEKKAAERFLAEVQAEGVEARIEPFTVKCGRVNHAKLVVTEPYVKEYEVTGYERSDSTPEGGLDLDFYYAEDCEDVHLHACRGKIVMINNRLGRKDYEKLQKAEAAAILTFSGTTLDRLSETDCDIRKLREILTDDFGFNIALHLRTMDAVEIVRRGAKKMHIEVDSERYDGESRNVCATIPGTTYPDEIVSFGAHYDSVHFSTGVYDNLSGSVIILELLRYFVKNPPLRTLKFNWFGSEEQGLLGSKAWVRDHADELDKHVLMINVDVAAPILGRNESPVIGTDAAVGYIDACMREAGLPSMTKAEVYSSDCVPFSDAGIPSVTFARAGAPGAGYIHDRRDNLRSKYIDEKALDITLQHSLYMSKRLVNSAIFPIERKISDEMRTKIDEYLFKKKDGKKE